MATLRLPSVDALRLPTRIPLRLRVFFRGAFGLLTLATVALALTVLQEEKQRSYANYQDGFAKTQAQIVARLRHPTGQLALLNPGARGVAGAAVTPLVLPFAAIDFDDKAKAQQAVEMAGCLVQYVGKGGDDASLCVAVGSNPLAGGFIYTVGSFASDELVPRRIGELDLRSAHRVRVSVAMRGQTWRWLAPFETPQEAATSQNSATRGRLTGFAEDEQGHTADKPVRDFRGWLWQDARCLEGSAAEHCLRRSFFSLRLPVELFRDELQAQRGKLVWPPADLDRIVVRLQVLPPGADAQPLFDSAQAGARPPFALDDLASLLMPGETLRIRKLGGPAGAELATLTGHDDHSEPVSPLLDRLIRQLPVDGYDQPLQATDTIATASGRYELVLTGDVRSVNRALSRVATRVGWFVGALLAAIALTWAAIELRVIRRITVLTKRAAAVSRSVKGSEGGEISLDVADLRGGDELGLLAGTLADLMQRVNDDVRREHIRAAQEKDQWHAVGHEIMSPLQSLMVLHGSADDPSHRYIQRMQQAVRVLYGQASPTEAFEATTLGVQALDLNEFLQHVAENAPHAGIAEVHYATLPAAVLVKGDEYALEDVVTHVLRNAERHRTPGTPITLALDVLPHHAELRIHNEGVPIGDELIERIFEYGVSEAAGAAEGTGHRGQGLFVARTYMAKMGGTIEARNEGDGVNFVLRLQRA
jgi:signal transduction histidine kinase